MITVLARNAPIAFEETMWQFKAYESKIIETRGGPAVTLPQPIVVEIGHPEQRVVACPIRDANPFFHVMEWVWMLAGEREVEWILKFNKNYINFANDWKVHGAYGYRWRKRWGDQIKVVIQQLKDDKNTRQAVLNMWDPETDPLPHWKDRPCNTQIVFRGGESLSMTVFNRSNDLFWGMFGANIVHMTFLHEMVAALTGLPLGIYRVVSNNLHYYVMENYPVFPFTPVKYDIYDDCSFYPFVGERESYEDLVQDASNMVRSIHEYKTKWFQNVGLHIHNAYLDKEHRYIHIMRIKAEDWQTACLEWANRRMRE
jgi:hypothetical protein